MQVAGDAAAAAATAWHARWHPGSAAASPAFLDNHVFDRFSHPLVSEIFYEPNLCNPDTPHPLGASAASSSRTFFLSTENSSESAQASTQRSLRQTAVLQPPCRPYLTSSSTLLRNRKTRITDTSQFVLKSIHFSSVPMLTSFNGFGLSPHPMSLLHHMHRHQPATSFRRSVTSSVRSLSDGKPDVVFESRTEESTGSGQKRVVIERGLGSKLMKLTQISDGCGGASEERVFTNVSKEDETLFDDSNWHQAAAQHKLPTVPVQKAVMASSASCDAGTSNNGSGSIPNTADAVAQAPGEQEMDEHGVPITGSFEAREDGSFHETSPASTFGPTVNAEVAHDKPQSGQQQQQQVQRPLSQCVKQQEQQHEKCSRAAVSTCLVSARFQGISWACSA